MQTYLAFLRGINVGGKNLISMPSLRETLAKAGFSDVRTYIQSGNVLFSSSNDNTDAIAKLIRGSISGKFGIDIGIAVFSKADWRRIIAEAPKDWGKDPAWKHNLLILLKPYNMEQVMQDIGTLKPGIETLSPGRGVLYQSVSWEFFGRSTSGKLAANPLYKRMTIRNYNTSVKLAGLLDEQKD